VRRGGDKTEGRRLELLIKCNLLKRKESGMAGLFINLFQ